jgi:hypothetical protein
MEMPGASLPLGESGVKAKAHLLKLIFAQCC